MHVQWAGTAVRLFFKVYQLYLSADRLWLALPWVREETRNPPVFGVGFVRLEGGAFESTSTLQPAQDRQLRVTVMLSLTAVRQAESKYDSRVEA